MNDFAAQELSVKTKDTQTNVHKPVLRIVTDTDPSFTLNKQDLSIGPKLKAEFHLEDLARNFEKNRDYKTGTAMADELIASFLYNEKLSVDDRLGRLKKIHVRMMQNY